MKLAELKERIDNLCITEADENLDVLMASDPEGNEFHDVADVLLDWDEEDPGTVKSVTIWP